jgi:hypothetical protein
MTEQDLVYRLRKRAEIRRQIPGRKSVQEGAADRIADLLEEAALELEQLRSLRFEIMGVLEDVAESGFDAVCETTLKHVLSRLSPPEPEPEPSKLIGYAEREEGFYPLYAPGEGYIVTHAFILCKYCGGSVYHCMGPRSDAVCLTCYEKDPDAR